MRSSMPELFQMGNVRRIVGDRSPILPCFLKHDLEALARADDAGRRPRSQDTAVNRADVADAEQIGDVGGNGREAAAIQRQDDREEGDQAPG